MDGTAPPPRLHRARAALAAGFLLQGATFALLVTCIPELQERYGLSDALLPLFLAAVPVLAGVGSVLCERVVRRTGARAVLRAVQPGVCLTLAGAGLGSQLWQLALVLGLFGLLVGALDASMNMLGVGLQRRFGRSIMIGFHAAFSLGGILGAAAAGIGAHYRLGLPLLFGTCAAVIAPAAVLAGRLLPGPAELAGPERPVAPGRAAGEEHPATGPATDPAPAPAAAAVPWGPLLPLCLVMAFAYIADASVANYSVKYLTDALDSPEDLAKLSYLGYTLAMLLGRAVGDRAVQRLGAVPVVRAGAALAAVGFVVAAAAPGPGTAVAGFTLLGLGICAIIPQVFAAGGQLLPAAADTAVARLNLFNYVGFLVGSPLVGALAGLVSYRLALLAPTLLLLAVLPLAGRFAPSRAAVPAALPTAAPVGAPGADPVRPAPAAALPAPAPAPDGSAGAVQDPLPGG